MTPLGALSFRVQKNSQITRSTSGTGDLCAEAGEKHRDWREEGHLQVFDCVTKFVRIVKSGHGGEDSSGACHEDGSRHLQEP